MDESSEIAISADVYAIGAFVAYLLVLVGIGIYTSKYSSKEHK